ncbi:MAG: T9SS type A sorting domain-containing protein [Crocinitomicaceae bacterium]
MKKTVQIIAGFFLFSSSAFSQFIVKNTYFESTGISNLGQVVGYEGWAGPYSTWTPETQVVDTIYGLAPGNGVGGQAHYSNDGNYISGTMQGTPGPEMARYNTTTNSWTSLGSLGFSIGGVYSGGYSISGDGLTVVGNSYADTTTGLGYTDAVAWNAVDGIIDLGTLFAGKSTRANAVNSDGSTIVGWQDFNGPWKSAVWRKNASGGYDANEYLLIDPQGSATDEYNQLGECTAISGDGNWIGGYGDFATNGNPYLWNATAGYVDLGNLSPNGSGYVAGINNDGSMAVGRIQQGPWDPELPFVWTAAGGMQNLNDYANNVLGISTGTKKIYSANCFSKNGVFIAGYGVDTVTYEYFTYRLSLGNLSTENLTMESMEIYPNPAQDYFTVKNTGVAMVHITNLEGKNIYAATIHGDHTIDVSNIEAGIYFITLQSSENQLIQQSKLVIE